MYNHVQYKMYRDVQEYIEMYNDVQRWMCKNVHAHDRRIEQRPLKVKRVSASGSNKRARRFMEASGAGKDQIRSGTRYYRAAARHVGEPVVGHALARLFQHVDRAEHRLVGGHAAAVPATVLQKRQAPKNFAEAQTCEEGGCMGIRTGGSSMCLWEKLSLE
ncbi:predicted protein [Postia placenta Mad-698-R]|nr:predicted protein [Postia placenta Mad-698-R]EED83834.1 predicted protein [Postia placenta Mad-698-R]